MLWAQTAFALNHVPSRPFSQSTQEIPVPRNPYWTWRFVCPLFNLVWKIVVWGSYSSKTGQHMIKYEKGENELLIWNCSGNVSYQSANIRLSGLVFFVWLGLFFSQLGLCTVHSLMTTSPRSSPISFMVLKECSMLTYYTFSNINKWNLKRLQNNHVQ